MESCHQEMRGDWETVPLSPLLVTMGKWLIWTLFCVCSVFEVLPCLIHIKCFKQTDYSALLLNFKVMTVSTLCLNDFKNVPAVFIFGCQCHLFNTLHHWESNIWKGTVKMWWAALNYKHKFVYMITKTTPCIYLQASIWWEKTNTRFYVPRTNY